MSRRVYAHRVPDFGYLLVSVEDGDVKLWRCPEAEWVQLRGFVQGIFDKRFEVVEAELKPLCFRYDGSLTTFSSRAEEVYDILSCQFPEIAKKVVAIKDHKGGLEVYTSEPLSSAERFVVCSIWSRAFNEYPVGFFCGKDRMGATIDDFGIPEYDEDVEWSQ